jgi:hypothetical protein
MSCHLIALGAMAQSLSNQGVSLDQTLLSKFSTVIPDSIRFKQTRQALKARRTPVKIPAESLSYASNNNKQVKIKLPNNALYDTRHGYLSFDCAIAVTGGTYRRLAYGAFSAFDRLNVKFGSGEVENISDYNRIQNLEWESGVIPDVTTAFGSTNTLGCLGFGTASERNALGLLNAQYSMPIYSGVLNGALLPFENIRSGMEITFYIGDPTTFVETDGTNPIVTISNVKFHIERLELEQKYLSFIANYIHKNGLQIGFHSMERYTNSLTTGTQQSLTIQNKSSSVSALMNLFVDSTTINSTTTNDKFLTWTPQNLTSYSTLINGAIFPDEAIDCETNGAWDAYQIYLRYCNKWKLNGMINSPPAIPFEYFKVNRFLFIVDLEAYPETEGLINPFSTLGNNSTTILKLTFSSAVSAGLQCDTWVRVFKQISIFSDGSTRVIN